MTAVTLFGSALRGELMEEQEQKGAASCVRVGIAAAVNCSENKMPSTWSRK